MAYEKRYNPDRSADWNYGGSKWRLSRSKIDLFLECPRCFYLDNKLGTGRPKGPSFTLNIAVDALLKKEFDVHRKNRTAHPLMTQYKVKGVPFDHDDFEMWRENFKGLEYTDPETGLVVSGAIDDVWQNEKGELIVVDYKATSKEGVIETLADSSWEDQYKRQMGVYQWLLEKNGFPVSKTGYFVYANARVDLDAFNEKLDFVVTLVPCVGDNAWIESALAMIDKTLKSNAIPPSHKDCEYCMYREAAGKKFKAHVEKYKK